MRRAVNILSQISSGTDNPLFMIEECDFGVICKSVNCESVYWYDNKGSVGKFYNFLGLEKDIALVEEKKLNDKLVDLTTDNIAEIKEDIAKLLSILDKGEYDVNYFESNNEHNKDGFNYYNIVFPKYDNSELSEKELEEDFHKLFMKVVKDRGNIFPPELIDYSAINFYDGYETHMLATKHESHLDSSRIHYYKEQLRKGKRPPIIILSCTSQVSILNSFIIDGHHKAIAYLQEKINPALIEIKGSARYSNDTIKTLKQVSTLMFREQFEYLILSNYVYYETNTEICNDEYLANYCLNGLIIKKYPNNIVRMKGHYINNKRHGIFEWFYPDGSLKERSKYENNSHICTFEMYFHDGTLLQRGNENGIIERYDIYGNRIPISN